VAITVFKNARIEVSGNVISDHISEVSIETERDEQDATAFGANNKVVVAGLGDATITMTAFNDYAAGALDSILFPLSTSNSPFTVKVRPDAGAISTSNPEYTMTALMLSYSPIAGTVGEVASTELSFRNASQAGLTRATA
jgi:hypothetical protein